MPPADPAPLTPPADVPTVAVDGSAAGWLELLLTGGRPRSGYVGVADARRAREAGELADGTPCGVPPELVVDEATAGAAAAAGRARLTDAEGNAVAELTVQASEQVPGQPRWQLSGPVRVLGAFVHHDHERLRRDAGTVRADGPWAMSWADAPTSRVLVEAAERAAADAGLPLLHVTTIDPRRGSDTAAHLGARLLARSGAAGLLLPFPDQGWDAGALLERALVARDHGATLLLVEPGRLGALDEEGRSRLLHQCGRAGVQVTELSPARPYATASELLSMLDRGAAIPADQLPADLAEDAARAHRPPSRRGYTVFFTGLSGSGKSTLAARLVAALLEREHRSVTLLDGDAVRLHLSRGLGFSAQDRATNVLRVGYVAAEITKAGGVAVCCPIAPQDAVRQAVRRMVRDHGSFVLVHVATPLEECERRDRKGLYARARQGLVPEFTGISSPYEEPQDADIVIDTTGRALDECVQEVLDHLVQAELLTG